jgi:hypothetical protein
LKSENIEFINRFVDIHKGKYISGGRTVLFTLKFYLNRYKTPLILKMYNKISPIQIINHLLSVRIFNQEFEKGIPIKDYQFYVYPSKNLIVSYSPECKCVILIQEFSEGSVPNSDIPLSSICKVIGKKGYVIDFFSKNWRILSTNNASVIKLNYIDILFSNKIGRNDKITELNQKLNSRFFVIKS